MIWTCVCCFSHKHSQTANTQKGLHFFVMIFRCLQLLFFERTTEVMKICTSRVAALAIKTGSVTRKINQTKIRQCFCIIMQPKKRYHKMCTADELLIRSRSNGNSRCRLARKIIYVLRQNKIVQLDEFLCEPTLGNILKRIKCGARQLWLKTALEQHKYTYRLMTQCTIKWRPICDWKCKIQCICNGKHVREWERMQLNGNKSIDRMFNIRIHRLIFANWNSKFYYILIRLFIVLRRLIISNEPHLQNLLGNVLKNAWLEFAIKNWFSQSWLVFQSARDSHTDTYT